MALTKGVGGCRRRALVHARPQLLDDLPAELEGLHQLEAYVHEGRAATKPRSSSFTYTWSIRTATENDSAERQCGPRLRRPLR